MASAKFLPVPPCQCHIHAIARCLSYQFYCLATSVRTRTSDSPGGCRRPRWPLPPRPVLPAVPVPPPRPLDHARGHPPLPLPASILRCLPPWPRSEKKRPTRVCMIECDVLQLQGNQLGRQQPPVALGLVLELPTP